MKRLLIVLLLLWGGSAAAFEPFVVGDIRVEGLQRMSAGTVFNYLPVRVGDTLTAQGGAEAIRALFDTGFFRDVQLERDGDVLVVVVDERRAISDIEIKGNRDIDTEPLLDSLKQIGFAEGRVFDRSLLDKVEQELRRQYFANGKYAVKIDTTVTPLERNRVAINIDISEGRVAKISQINIVGNESFDDEALLESFQLSTPTMFSFYTKADQYSKQKLAGDLESLRSFYLDRGYINFNIDSTQVSISPDKKDIYITINVTEGEQYRVREVRLAGELVVAAEELFPLVEINAGDLFSRKRITSSVDAIGRRLSDDGYAFANVNMIPDIDEEAKEVDVTLYVDPGNRVYVRRVNMSGNTRTRDEVLRREMRQMEGGWFSGGQVERSKVRLERLGYFSEVNVETPAVPGTTDQVDVNYSVTERPSGSLLFGVGYAQSSGVLVNASVSQDNFLGTGKRVNAEFNNSNVNTVYSFSYLNPYYTIDGVSRGFGLFYRETDAAEANVSDYNTNIFGGNVSHGIPLSEHDTVRVNLEYENLALDTTVFSPTEVSEFIAQNGDQFDTFKVTGTWTHDTRNRAIFPTQGTLQRLGAEVTVPGLDLEYYKLNYRYLMYVPLTRLFTLSLNADIGYGESYGDLEELPFFENYYAGGVRSVRGFEDNTLGPRDSNNNPLGGSFRTVGNVELHFPPPLFTDSNSVRLSGFFDVGNVFPGVDDFEVGELRYSIGMGIMWYSPLGPLSFSLAKPLNDEADDDTQVFQFTLGTTF